MKNGIQIKWFFTNTLKNGWTNSILNQNFMLDMHACVLYTRDFV